MDTFKWKNNEGRRDSYEWDQLMEQLRELETDEFALEITREVNDGLSFSADAIEDLARVCMCFALARSSVYWKTHHEPPSRMKITFKLDLDHKRATGLPERLEAPE